MSKLPTAVVEELTDATQTYVEQILDIADKNGIDRNELMGMAGPVFLMTSIGDFSNYYETEEKRELVNG